MLSRLMTIREQLILFGLACALVIGALSLRFYSKQHPLANHATFSTEETAYADTVLSAPASEPAPPAGSAVAPLPAPRNIVVAVTGAVAHEQVYYIPEGRRVCDALALAGGALDSADLSDINQAARLMDGTTLTVPFQPDKATYRHRVNATALHSALNPWPYTHSGWGAGREDPQISTAPAYAETPALPMSPTTRINLNTADAAALETLPGIGPALAARIIAYRQQQPFGTAEDLMAVSGIGPKRFENIASLVTVSGPN